MSISFNISVEDSDHIYGIIRRLNPPAKHILTLTMSLTAFHAKHGLRLEDMLIWDDLKDVMHDVYGINENLDRMTGELENCFWPRFAKEK